MLNVPPEKKCEIFLAGLSNLSVLPPSRGALDSQLRGEALHRRAHCSRESGFTLLASGLCVVALLGMLGLAVDVGRLFIVRNELQTYADAAALSAALGLDGTPEGIIRAVNAVKASANRWNMNAFPVTGAIVEFSTTPDGVWVSNPDPASDYSYVRVRVSVSLPLYFIPVVATIRWSTVQAAAVAGQIPVTSFSDGLLPFSPFPHDETDPNYGYIPGQQYTLRWGSNPKLGPNVCPGDNSPTWISIAQGASASERGYIEETSAAVIRAAIEQGYQTRSIAVGDTVTMTGGNKQTEGDSLVARVNQDTDPGSPTYADYVSAGLGNGRRLVVVPISTWYPEYKVIGFAAFFLLPPSEYSGGGTKSFCAEYVGPYVQGSRYKGTGAPGAYAVRLVR